MDWRRLVPSSKGLKFAGFSLILTMKIPCLRVSQSLTESQQTLQKLCDEALFFCFLYFTLICFDPKSQDLPRPPRNSQLRLRFQLWCSLPSSSSAFSGWGQLNSYSAIPSAIPLSPILSLFELGIPWNSYTFTKEFHFRMV